MLFRSITFNDQLIYSANNGPLAGFRNKIINGCFRLWQRATSQTSSGYGSDDRWGNLHGGGTTKTHSQQVFTVGQTDVPGNPEYYSRTVVTTGGGTSDYCIKQQKIEGVQTFSGETAIISFCAKADASRNIAIEYNQVFGSGGSSSVDSIEVTTYNLTTSWQEFYTVVEMPSISGKAIGIDDSLNVNIWLDAGTTFDSRTNSLGNQSGTFDISQIQLEPGPYATPFENRPFGTEFDLCERYWEKSYRYNQYVQSNTARGAASITFAAFSAT